MVLDKLVQHLTSLDLLEESESNVYMLLLDNPEQKPLAVREISDLLEMNRTFVYEVMDSLYAKKLVNVIDNQPKKYTARDPKTFLNIVIDKLENKISEIQNIVKVWEEDVVRLPHILFDSPSSCGLYFPPTDKRF